MYNLQLDKKKLSFVISSELLSYYFQYSKMLRFILSVQQW